MSNLASIFPFFIVADLKSAVSFYTGKLGFKVQYTGPDDDPYWAIVGRDDISIMLKKITDDIKPVPNHTLHEWAPWDAYVYVSDPDSLFEEYRTNGVTFRQPLKDDNDNLRGFEVMDADGYVLFFGRPIPQKNSSSSVPAFKKMSPQLPVADIGQSIEFYTKKLGFSLEFKYEDFYAGILKDGHSIHLKSGGPTDPDAKNKDDLDITFSVDNIERLYEEFLNRSIEIVQPLRDMPYGREFYIADPDGNRLAFLE
jgi:catechol 2,3-dioxygenase-like lactoylglutathione lyase family enzyme